MRSKKTNRAITLIVVMSCIMIGTWVALENLNKSIMFFYTPSELHTTKATSKYIKVGGVVKLGTVKSSQKDNSLITKFILTDCTSEVIVEYLGLLPSLFREGQGIVATGKLNQDRIFTAKELLTKHDENYVPREVKNSLPENSICNPKNYKK